MAFTSQEAIDDAKSRLGITVTSKDSTFLSWMDDANAELYMLYSECGESWKETIQYKNITADVREITLDYPAYHISKVFFKEADKYYELDYKPNVLRRDYNPTNPESRNIECFAIRDENTIVLDGTPLTSVTNGLRIDVLLDESALALTTSITRIRAYKLFYVMYLCKTYRQSQIRDTNTINEYALEYERIYAKIQQLLRNKFKGPKQLSNYMA
jgi:hypothetical protein